MNEVLWIGLAMMAGTVMAIAHKRTRAAGVLIALAATCVWPLFHLDTPDHVSLWRSAPLAR